MSQVKIQEFIVQEAIINRMADFKKGQTLASRDASSERKWTKFLAERGYTEQEATIIFKDALDMAILEVKSND